VKRKKKVSKSSVILLVHQAAEYVDSVAKLWCRFVPKEDLLLTYGGKEEEFEKISFPNKVFVADPRLRTVDHGFEKQSYSEVFANASHWMSKTSARTGLFVESDVYPLRPDLMGCLENRLGEEKADGLACWLRDVTDSSEPHYLASSQKIGYGL